MCMVGSLGGAANPQQAASDYRSLFPVPAPIDPARLRTSAATAPISYDGRHGDLHRPSGRVLRTLARADIRARAAPHACWYYGHIHNGIVYNPGKNPDRQHLAAPLPGQRRAPYGNAWGLAGNPGGAIPTTTRRPTRATRTACSSTTGSCC